MNTITIIIWIMIAIIATISITIVKLHYKKNETDEEEEIELPTMEKIDDDLTIEKKDDESQDNTSKDESNITFSKQIEKESPQKLFRPDNDDDTYIIPEVKENNLKNYEYASQNQVLIKYDNQVKKFQEPIKQNQMDIMNRNNKDTSELKDLFTIDELIKESKRKDSEREKESQTIQRVEDDAELNKIKESIKNKTPEPLIEEVPFKDKRETIGDLIKDNETDNIKESSTTSNINETVNSTPKETSKIEDKTQQNDITNILLNQKEISEPALKTPSKVDEKKENEFGVPIDDTNLFDENEENEMDLDYRKDLDKVKNKITGSKIFKEVKEKLTPEEIPQEEEMIQNEFIRNVNEYEEYDDYEPIINETHVNFNGNYDDYHAEQIRQENTRRVFLPKVSLEDALPKIGEIKKKPPRKNIKLNINNNEVVLKKGDEIIFNHEGESYSSQVYAINGDEISVKYRRKNIKIKPDDVKKIY